MMLCVGLLLLRRRDPQVVVLSRLGLQDKDYKRKMESRLQECLDRREREGTLRSLMPIPTSSAALNNCVLKSSSF